MDRRVVLLKEMSKDPATAIRPHHTTESPFGYAYPKAQRVFRTRTGGEVELLDHLADVGYLDRDFSDVIHLCPRCHWFTLNFREECPTCASANLTVVAMVHHFKCGHVAPEQDFQAGPEMACPKCLGSLKHLGVDYERPATNYLCGACRQVFRDPDVSCLCLTCGSVMDADAAIVRVMHAYRVTPKGTEAADRGVIEELGPQAAFMEPGLGLYTWPFFLEELNLEIARAGRFQFPLSVLLVRVEAAEGAALGTLREAGRRLKEGLRATDLVASYGENVFAALLPGTGPEAALLVADRVSHNLLFPEAAGEEVGVRVSTGVASLSAEVATASALVSAAEAKLERATHPAVAE